MADYIPGPGPPTATPSSTVRRTTSSPAPAPMRHHTAARMKVHILVSFLSYVLCKALAQWMRGAGLGDGPQTLLEQLAKMKSGDVVLPARTA